MGIFNIFEDIKDWVSDRKLDIEIGLSVIADEVAGLFRSRNPYDGSVSDAIDIEKQLAKYRKDIEEEAEKLEQEKIERVGIGFDKFIEVIEDDYPELVSILKEKKTNIEESIKGTIINNIKKYVSENDSDFRKILEMPSGTNKEHKMREKLKVELKKAEKSFDSKLETNMRILNNELEIRLLDELQKKADILKKDTEIYEKLEKESLRGQVDIEKQQASFRYAVEIENCLKEVMDEES